MNKHSITHASSLVSQSGEIDDEQDNGNNVRALLLLLCVLYLSTKYINCDFTCTYFLFYQHVSN